MIKCTGENVLDGHDDANIPCNLFIRELSDWDLEKLQEREADEEDGDPASKWAKWKLTGDCFMPRKGLWDGCIEYVASTREELSELVKTQILPSYKIAFDAVTAMSEGKRKSFYYWQKDDDGDEA
jgi:hypothetical protein